MGTMHKKNQLTSLQKKNMITFGMYSMIAAMLFGVVTSTDDYIFWNGPFQDKEGVDMSSQDCIGKFYLRSVVTTHDDDHADAVCTTRLDNGETFFCKQAKELDCYGKELDCEDSTYYRHIRTCRFGVHLELEKSESILKRPQEWIGAWPPMPPSHEYLPEYFGRRRLAQRLLKNMVQSEAN